MDYTIKKFNRRFFRKGQVESVSNLFSVPKPKKKKKKNIYIYKFIHVAFGFETHF